MQALQALVFVGELLRGRQVRGRLGAEGLAQAQGAWLAARPTSKGGHSAAARKNPKLTSAHKVHVAGTNDFVRCVICVELQLLRGNGARAERRATQARSAARPRVPPSSGEKLAKRGSSSLVLEAVAPSLATPARISTATPVTAPDAAALFPWLAPRVACLCHRHQAMCLVIHGLKAQKKGTADVAAARQHGARCCGGASTTESPDG